MTSTKGPDSVGVATVPVPSPAAGAHPAAAGDALAAAIAGRTPVKVAGLTDSWAAGAWNFADLRALAGDRRVTALVDLPAHGGELPAGQRAHEQELSFAAFLDLATADPAARSGPCYLGYTRPSGLIPDYERAFDFGPLTPRDGLPTDTRLWIGSAGTCSGLHSDLKDNVFAQIEGVKRVFLVSLAETHRVYPYLDNLVNSRVDPEHYDRAAFPRFARATVYQTTVGPGELLFIPRGWWHYLRAESPSISINHWFGPQVPASFFLRLLLRLGPRYQVRTLIDLVRHGLLGRGYREEFFFTPPSTGRRLYDLLRHGDFSRGNDPVTDERESIKCP